MSFRDGRQQEAHDFFKFYRASDVTKRRLLPCMAPLLGLLDPKSTISICCEFVGRQVVRQAVQHLDVSTVKLL